MPSAPTIRLAVSSRDGVSVNQRYRRAEDLFIFDAVAGEVVFIERRVKPAEPALATILQDCRAVISLGFTAPETRFLRGKGFAVFEGRGEITAVVRDYLSHPEAASNKE
jgi:hypothetical protein